MKFKKFVLSSFAVVITGENVYASKCQKKRKCKLGIVLPRKCKQIQKMVWKIPPNLFENLLLLVFCLSWSICNWKLRKPNSWWSVLVFPCRSSWGHGRLPVAWSRKNKYKARNSKEDSQDLVILVHRVVHPFFVHPLTHCVLSWSICKLNYGSQTLDDWCWRFLADRVEDMERAKKLPYTTGHGRLAVTWSTKNKYEARNSKESSQVYKSSELFTHFW